MSNIKTVLEMAQTRVKNKILDCNTIENVWINNNELVLELADGCNFSLSMNEVKHQAREFIEEI